MTELSEKALTLEQELSNERKRISTERLDLSFGEIINMYKLDELIIRPEFQRLYRWNDQQKTAFIESILLGIPIPPIFVSENKKGVWELIDGLQRITTFISFFGELQEDLTITEVNTSNPTDEELDHIEGDNTPISLLNNWKLLEGDIIKSLEGLSVKELPKKIQLNLKRAVLRVEILRGDTNEDYKYELFKRLNSGGSKATPQELRNAIYRGKDDRLNKLLEKLSQEESFIQLTDLSSQKKRELFDQELVLRFIALLEKKEDINSNLEEFLNNFFKDVVEGQIDVDLDNLEKVFKNVFDVLISLQNSFKNDYKNGIFKNERNNFVPSYFEAISIGLANNLDDYRLDSSKLNKKIKELREDEEFKRLSGSASSSKSRLKNRMKRVNELFSNNS